MAIEGSVNKLKGLVNNATEFSDEQKEKYVTMFDEMAQHGSEELAQSLDALAVAAEHNVNRVREFFLGMSKAMLTYIKDGEEGVGKLLDEQAKSEE